MGLAILLSLFTGGVMALLIGGAGVALLWQYRDAIWAQWIAKALIAIAWLLGVAILNSIINP